jgi:hypothetical protein
VQVDFSSIQTEIDLFAVGISVSIVLAFLFISFFSPHFVFCLSFILKTKPQRIFYQNKVFKSPSSVFFLSFV